jgi:hypothetical protein
MVMGNALPPNILPWSQIPVKPTPEKSGTGSVALFKVAQVPESLSEKRSDPLEPRGLTPLK